MTMLLNIRRDAIEKRLFNEHGPVIGGAALWRLLGYRTSAAFRQAVKRGRLVVPTFRIEGRHPRFASTRDVALWIATMETRASDARSRAPVTLSPSVSPRPID